MPTPGQSSGGQRKTTTSVWVYGGLNNDPKTPGPNWESENITLFGKIILVNVIELRILMWRDYPGS